MKLSQNDFRLFLLTCLILAISFYHFGTPGRLMGVHLVLQALFFVPVVLAGFWFGRKGGLLAAGAITILYAHHAVTVMMPTVEMAIINGVQIVLLFISGFLAGAYSESRRKTENSSETQPERKLLLYVDDSPAALNAARQIASIFGSQPGMEVTLLGVVGSAQEETFFADEAACQKNRLLLDSLTGVAEQARDLLRSRGFPDGNLNIRFANSPDGRIAETIINEQRSGGYSAIVIGRQDSQADSSLNGRIAASLVRSASCPVWVIGEDRA